MPQGASGPKLVQGTGGGGASSNSKYNFKYKKEPGVECSEDEEAPENACDDSKVNIKLCSERGVTSSQSPPTSSSTSSLSLVSGKSREKRSSCAAGSTVNFWLSLNQ